MNNVTVVLFGASGDLSKRKIIPALYHMFARKKFEKCLLVGAALDDISALTCLERAKPFISNLDATIWQKFVSMAYYQQLHFTQLDDYHRMQNLVSDVEKKHGMSGNRILYLAASAQFFCEITQYIASSGLALRDEKNARRWHRIIYEKPFGFDLQSAHAINTCIHNSFSEDQIYRIDHFLSKELVGNIALVRFTNCVFEPLWNNRYIDHVQIIINEKIGIEGRGTFYDHVGALSDVVQNHALELLALIAMEAPEKLTGELIRDQRAKVLSRVSFVDGILGQYDGYTSEHSVAPNSKTETFAALQLRVDNPRWSGVPFYIKTGKQLRDKRTEIHIKFKTVDCLLSKQCPSDPNYLTIEIAPKAGFILQLNAKSIGAFDAVQPVNMEFCHSCLYGPFTPEDYQILFEEIIRAEHSIGVRFDEIEYAWNIIDAIKQQQLPLYNYSIGSSGPKQLEDFAKKHGMRWRS